MGNLAPIVINHISQCPASGIKPDWCKNLFGRISLLVLHQIKFYRTYTMLFIAISLLAMRWTAAYMPNYLVVARQNNTNHLFLETIDGESGYVKIPSSIEPHTFRWPYCQMTANNDRNIVYSLVSFPYLPFLMRLGKAREAELKLVVQCRSSQMINQPRFTRKQAKHIDLVSWIAGQSKMTI